MAFLRRGKDFKGFKVAKVFRAGVPGLLSWADAWAVCQCSLLGFVTVLAFGGGGGGPLR